MEYDFERLRVYQEGIKLTEMVYEKTRNFPDEERYGLTSQIRRASLSIPLNISEGKGRYYTKVYVQFLYQARGSLYELITLVKMSMKFQYLSVEKGAELLGQANCVAVHLSKLVNSMR